MVEYIHYKRGSYIVIDNEQFRSIKLRMDYLKAVSFHSNDWQLFLEALKDKKMTLLEIAESMFGNKRNDELEKAIWTMLEMILEKNVALVQKYLEVHVNKCFNKYWIHRYAYFEYHGFSMDKGGFVRNKFDKGMDSFNIDMRTQIENILHMGRNDSTLNLRVYPENRYVAEINYMNEGWQRITLDYKESFRMHKDIICSLKMINTIKKILLKKNSLKKILKNYKVSGSTVVMYAFVTHQESFIKVLKKEFRRQLLNNNDISLSEAMKMHINQDTNILHRLKQVSLELYDRLVLLSKKYQSLQIKLYNILNKIQATKKLISYRFGYISNTKWQTFTLELNELSRDLIRKDLKEWALYRAKQDKNGAPIQKTVEFFKHAKSSSKYFNLSATDIKESDISSWLSTFKKAQTVRAAKNHISSFYIYIVNRYTVEGKKEAVALNKIQKIISNDFSVKGNEVENPTMPLPEEVYLAIRLHANELEPDIKNAYLIISATGCRPSELGYINVESMVEDKKMGCHVLKIYLGKQEKAYAKKGKKAIRKVPIYDEEVVQAFYNQVLLSEEYRIESGSTSIFIRPNQNHAHQVKFHIPSSKELSRSINALIEKYDIKADLEDEVWHYTPYQMRSMIATDMVEKGHAPEEIKAFFGWMTIHTPEKAYAYVRERKIEELNTSFFKKHFKVSFDEEVLHAYTREEKEQLFVELYIHKRKMEYGECIRHPIMGECGKLQAVESCASCARLITDVPYLNTWIKFRDNQKEILDGMVASLEAEGISKDEYTTWTEYIIQKHRLDSYQSLIDELESEKECKCPQ